jgi:hypothetical protein
MGTRQNYPTVAVQMVDGYNLQNLIEEAVENGLKKVRQEEWQSEKLYTINEVAKRLGKAHRTIKHWTATGALKTTPTGLISEKALQDYLHQ